MTAPLAPPRRHDIRWFAPSPLWAGLLSAPDPSSADLDRLQRPVLLRFATDAFMDELAAALTRDPAALAALEATPRSFRAAPPGMADDYEPPIDHVKLYQPVHGHFNLVAATLACRTVGLPDRRVDAACEITAFVLRRVDGGREYGWTADGWTPTIRADRFVAGERRIPLFPVVHQAGDTTRRLFVGLIPTSSTETARATALPLTPGPDDPIPPDGRPDQLVGQVVEPLRGLAESSIPDPLPEGGDPQAFRTAEAEQRAEVSRFVLLDLADFLHRHIPALWRALEQRHRPSGGAAMVAYDLLSGTWADAGHSATWLEALTAVWAERTRIWGDAGPPPEYVVDLAGGPMAPGLLRTRVVAALPPLTEAQLRAQGTVTDTPRFDPRPTARYVVRCGYARPHCGPRYPELLSEPSAPFAIASFFDTDAPARPVHIPLPLDTSIAGLRKAPRNVSVLISRELRGQMSRVVNLKKALDGKVGSADSFDLGTICSFSLPIITICALLLLLLIVAVLNIAFFWLPFFRICLPLPLKGRG